MCERQGCGGGSRGAGHELEKRFSRLPQGTKCSKADKIEATLSFLVPSLTREKVPTKPSL